MESKMDKYIINGGNKLYGSLQIKGAKNSVLPLLAGSILTNEKIILLNCPDITDVRNMLSILDNLGCKTLFDNGTITVDSSTLNNSTICPELAKELRSSIFLLGALLSRTGMAEVSYPGGCDIGLRPINLHISGLKALGVEITEEKDFLNCRFKRPKTCSIFLDLPSVGATENLIMASVFLEGETVIKNCAKEPEIVDLQNFLNMMGADIVGAGTKTIYINGVKKLHGIQYTPISDRIVAGTYLIAGAMCGGEICLQNAIAEHNVSLLKKLSKTTCNVRVKNDTIVIRNSHRLKSLSSVQTMYYPGFPTDLQTQMLALQTICQGKCIIEENIFETRFRPVDEFLKMGANIVVDNNKASIVGVEKLIGNSVVASDLRGGASLVLAALAAEGKSEVNSIFHIDRGYEDMAIQLGLIGADIIRK